MAENREFLTSYYLKQWNINQLLLLYDKNNSFYKESDDLSAYETRIQMYTYDRW